MFKRPLHNLRQRELLRNTIRPDDRVLNVGRYLRYVEQWCADALTVDPDPNAAGKKQVIHGSPIRRTGIPTIHMNEVIAEFDPTYLITTIDMPAAVWFRDIERVTTTQDTLLQILIECGFRQHTFKAPYFFVAPPPRSGRQPEPLELKAADLKYG